MSRPFLRHRATYLVGLAITFGWLAASTATAQDVPSFARDIQPILASRCVSCHGGSEPEAGLRLTDRAAALQELDSGEHAVVPGEPHNSALLQRVTSDDETLRMPPEGPPLTPEQIERLHRWIAAGAEWPGHWAYQPLTRPAVPSVHLPEYANWAQTPIDRFILQSLVQHGLTPSPPADRRTLLRRVYLDLIGLSPTPAERDAFLADTSPDAYERLVDRLLASPRYGERWARHWMDIVHFAETHGHDQDRPREHAWPYRDYLIDAWNQDKAYTRFVAEQVAGDVLFPDDPQALVATGFLAAGPWDESSLRDIREDTLDREIARYLDRDDIVTTVMSTFTSSTVHCARCHDHKFDPISQQQYYGLQAVFAATDKANRAYDPDPRVAARRRDLTEQLAALPERLARGDRTLLDPRIQQQVDQWAAAIAASGQLWQPAELVSFTSRDGSELVRQEDNSLLAGGPRPETDCYTIELRIDSGMLTGLRLELLPDDSLPQAGPGRQDNGNLHLSEIRAWVLPAEEGATPQPISLVEPQADFNQQGWTIQHALDGNPQTAWGIYPEVGKPHQAVFVLDQAVRRQEPFTLRVELDQLHGGGHLIGRLRLTVTQAEGPLSLAAVPSALAELLQQPPSDWSETQRIELAVRLLEQQLTEQLAALPSPQRVYCGTNDFEPDGSFRPASAPREVHVLHRGDVTQPLAPAEPLALSFLPDLPAELEMADPADEGQRRVALARWLTSPRNVITWRSIANRIWHYHFGRGIVNTPNDFGRMGGVPSHPELLDWLAFEVLRREFAASSGSADVPPWQLARQGASLKWLHRLIVTSAVYRQSSQYEPRAAAVDGENQYLWRMPRRRLDAESVRDSILRIAGNLDLQMGGPSVKQFIQTPGIHVTPNVDYQDFDVDDPANYRRSVYRFLFRTLPDPFMKALDCPDASQLTPTRNTSLTALQALAMLNDKLVIRQSEHIAERVRQDSDDLCQQVDQAFHLILGREPTTSERQAVMPYVTEHGMANLCRLLLNSNEFMFVD